MRRCNGAWGHCAGFIGRENSLLYRALPQRVQMLLKSSSAEPRYYFFQSKKAFHDIGAFSPHLRVSTESLAGL